MISPTLYIQKSFIANKDEDADTFVPIANTLKKKDDSIPKHEVEIPRLSDQTHV
ncbi:MAG TPA: hypothetical protein ACQGQG_02230 [Xylella sp.]